jgi:hypothetical protein
MLVMLYTLSVYPHRASLKNMPDHGGNRTYDLWNIRLSTLHQHRKIITGFKVSHHAYVT